MAQRRRQDLIMELIQQNGFVTTEQLVDQFKVTPQTIRRDLNDLGQPEESCADTMVAPASTQAR